MFSLGLVTQETFVRFQCRKGLDEGIEQLLGVFSGTALRLKFSDPQALASDNRFRRGSMLSCFDQFCRKLVHLENSLMAAVYVTRGHCLHPHSPIRFAISSTDKHASG